MSEDLILKKLASIVSDKNVEKKDQVYVVSPGNTDEIQKIVQAVNQHNMKLFTRTCDDEYHGANNVTSEGVLLDFGRMNKIMNLDLKSRSVTIEPGVTFIQLKKELEKHGLRAMNPLGLPASTSVLNCYVERSPLLSAPRPLLANGWQCTLDMEIVLPTGEILKTGASSLESMKRPFFWPFGGGPDLSRVFTAAQGTLGIASKVTIKVKAIPQTRKLLFITFKKIEEAVEPLYKIQRYEIGEECLLVNKFALSVMLSEDPLKRKELESTLPELTLLLVLAGPGEKMKYQEEDLKELGISSEKSLTILEKSEELLDEFSNPQRISRLLGYKTICRKISFYTTLDRMPELNLNVEQLIRKHNYPENEVGVLITPVELGHACFAEYYIFADRKNGDEENLQKLYDKLYEQLLNLGANIDRPFGRVAEMVYSKNPKYHSFLKSIKNQLDPKNVLNPGRLIVDS
ncbi:MAG: FAD-binding oxidoreductase [Candidatus Lokiarchaeia archaeon]